MPRRRFFLIVLGVLLSAGLAAGAESRPLRLLTVGNSFANDATRHLPALAEAGGKKLEILRANLGGHSLEQHAGYVTAYEADPADASGRPYTNHFSPTPQSGPKLGLKEILALRDWDYITIQQVSRQSFNAGSFEPFAGLLIAYLRAHAPNAEILIHQTWAYREDSPLYTQGEITAATMHTKLQANYLALAGRHRLRIVPVGDAFHAARQTERWQFKHPDPSFNYTSPPAGELPDQTGSLNIGWVWHTDPKSQQPVLRLDANHANLAGQYLGAAVFYQTLFKESVAAVDYVPEGLTAEEARSLRIIAEETVRRSPYSGTKP